MTKGSLKLSPENRLLLYCARTRVPEHMVADLNDLLTRGLDWAYITDAAFTRNIAQLLYDNLKNLGNLRLIPPEVMEDLKGAYHANIARNMFLYAELRNMVDAFRNAGVPVLVLKGAALAGIVYRDAGLRHMMDLDLLVRKDDLGTAQRVMTDMQYVAATGLQSEQWHREQHFHLPLYRHPEKPVVVEIHWHVTGSSSGLDITKWWERAREVDLMECRVLVFSPEDMLLHLCIHLFNHAYENAFVLRGLCDIAELLRCCGAEMDRELLQHEIQEYGMEKQVHSILYLVKRYHELPSPSQLLTNLDHADLRFIEILEKNLFADGGNVPINSHLLKSLIFDTVPEKVRYLLPRIFLSREEMAKRYTASPSSGKIFLYYLVHPFDLMAKYGKSLLAIFRTRTGRDSRD